MLLGAGFVVAAEIDDSSLFVEAFTAYQKKDYLQTIEKLGIINQLFPDTPLRDVALLLLARSGLKSGDNELAAKTVVLFNSEFPASPLKASMEEDLLHLGIRWQKGELLLPAIPLQAAARKVRYEQLALEKSTGEKTGQAVISLDTTADARIERERFAAEKVAREAVRASINLSGSVQTVAVGQRGEISFEVANLGPSDEDFVFETSAPPEFEAVLTTAGQSGEKLSPVTIATATPFKGSIMFRMPGDRVDGQKTTLSIRAVSEKYHHVVQAQDTQIITTAPLVRVVARPEKQKLAPGERTRYRFTVLNAGTLPALNLTVRVLLPAQLEILERGTPYFREAAGAVIFTLDTLNTGKLAEFALDVKVRENALFGQELRSRIEVINHQLQTKEIFTSTAAAVVDTQPLAVPLSPQ